MSPLGGVVQLRSFLSRGDPARFPAFSSFSSPKTSETGTDLTTCHTKTARVFRPLRERTRIFENGAHLGCKSPRNAQTAASSAAVQFRNQLPHNHLQRMTRAGFEPATYGLKERPSFIPRVRPRTSKFVPVLHLYSGVVRSRSSEFLGVPCTSRDKWGATRVQLFETRFAGFEPRTSR